jgi:hypothetical protein
MHLPTLNILSVGFEFVGADESRLYLRQHYCFDLAHWISYGDVKTSSLLGREKRLPSDATTTTRTLCPGSGFANVYDVVPKQYAQTSEIPRETPLT